MKLSLQFRGREIEMQSIGRDLFQVLIKPYSFKEYRGIDRHCLSYAKPSSLCAVQKFVDDVGTEAAVASKPEMQGRIMSMILTPVKV